MSVHLTHAEYRAIAGAVTLPAGIFVDGRAMTPRGETFDALNPATSERLVALPVCDAAAVDEAVAKARQAFESGPWPRMSVNARGRLLWKIADLIMKRREEISELETLDSGKPITDNAKIDIPMDGFL